jgi:hypothetical protein
MKKKKKRRHVRRLKYMLNGRWNIYWRKKCISNIET